MTRVYTKIHTLLLLCLMAGSGNLTGQDLEVRGDVLNNKSYGEEISQYFNVYQLVRPSYSLTPDELQKYQEINLVLKLGDIDATIALTRHSLLSDHYMVSGDQSQLKNKKVSQPLNFIGNIANDATSLAHLNLVNGNLLGYITLQGETYWVESAYKFDSSLPKQTLVVYKSSDVITSKKQFCASHEVSHKTDELKPTIKSAACELVEIAIALDHSYVSRYNGPQGAIDHSTAIMELAAVNYTGSFNKNIRFEIVEHYWETSAAQNTWGESIQATVLLDAFTAWAPSGFNNAHDLGQLWTAENIWEYDTQGSANSGIAGLAWVGTVCSGLRYHILEDYTSTAWALRVLTAHEMGHNFGAGHSSGIMAGTVGQNTNTWSSGSISEINAKLNQYTCMSDCLLGSCSEIINVRTTGCTPGAPSRYTLSFDLAHGGGGNSTGFQVNVDGETFEFQWETSPQTVTIPNLIANGTQNLISIQALDGSDTDCNGESYYEEPADDCSFNESVNFDNCQIPEGWASATTQGSIINGGDPMVQYKWKFLDANRTIANYDNGPNENSLLSIDGSCMAIMDDDLFSVNWYSGIVTLTTSDYDMEGYDEVSVSFDYNFHAFEDGKPANNSYLLVQVWNGSEYISILTDTESKCPWSDVWQTSCNDNFQMNLTEYANANLHFKFIYSDGNTGSWAGMAAIDNFKLSATVTSEGCMNEITLTGNENSGTYQAELMVNTSGHLTVNEPLTIMSPQVQINSGFEVLNGTDFNIISEGCTTY